MSTSCAPRPATHRPPTTRHHLHAVLAAAEAHLDAAAAPWRKVVYCEGEVTIEPQPGDLHAVCAAFGLGEPHLELHLIASGDTWVVVANAATGQIDGRNLRVWAPAVITRAEHEHMLLAARLPEGHR